MGIKRRRPVTPSQRFQSYLDTGDITTKKPERSLVVGKKRSSCRNAYGRITVRHRGGGVVRKYRLVDFKRLQRDVPGTVKTIEYDPNRNVRIGLVVYKNGAKSSMLLPDGIAVDSTVIAVGKAEAKVGNALPLKNIPVGFMVHNIEIKPGSGGKMARSAGTSAQLVSKSGDYVTLKLPSSEVRMVRADCWATVGTLGNAAYKNISWGKAGRIRRLGWRPGVRGMAMNPVDHPHGGGEGRSKSGSHPRTPWGKGCKGTRTRTRKNPLIIRRRSSGKGK